jgi:hypothetical protein
LNSVHRGGPGSSRGGVRPLTRASGCIAGSQAANRYRLLGPFARLSVVECCC